MAAPNWSARLAPLGRKMDDGFPTTISFEAAPDIGLWEKTVTPPGVDGGDPVETTTMHNLKWRTMAARKLKTLTEMSFTAAYDPAIYALGGFDGLLNIETAITVHFPESINGAITSLVFWGYLQKFEPDEISEGEQPEAEVTICPTNTDPLDGSESAPYISFA